MVLPLCRLLLCLPCERTNFLFWIVWLIETRLHAKNDCSVEASKQASKSQVSAVILQSRWFSVRDKYLQPLYNTLLVSLYSVLLYMFKHCCDRASMCLSFSLDTNYMYRDECRDSDLNAFTTQQTNHLSFVCTHSKNNTIQQYGLSLFSQSSILYTYVMTKTI